MDDALVGRGPELVLLGDFLTRSAADGGALLLTGEPGVGKTALLGLRLGGQLTPEQDGAALGKTGRTDLACPWAADTKAAVCGCYRWAPPATAS